MINDCEAATQTGSGSISGGFMNVMGFLNKKKKKKNLETISELVFHNSLLVTICLDEIHNYDLLRSVM